MKLSFGAKSMIAFVLSVLFLILLTLFESLLSGVSAATERGISLAFLVLPGVIGVVYGILAVRHKESKIWVAYLGILINALFALFHSFVISFAG
jgi:hypothetical protein